ncbi:MAG TPA: DUF4013 domain-containing protein [Anaerolineales bacterium]|nr:DUF4013 domain-containing protein [Anaerolineales bacterium]
MDRPSAISSLKPYFRFPLKGEQVANRFIIGSGLLLASFIVPILPALFVAGYGVQVMRRVTAGEPPTMRAWQDWGALLSDGFRAWVISLVFFLPGVIVLVGGYAVYFASFLSMSSASGYESDAGIVLPFLIGVASMFIGLGLSTLLFVVASILFPAALAHFAAEDRFAAAFQIGTWWRVLRSNLLGFLIAWIIVVGLMGVIYFVSLSAYFTLVLICLLPILLLPAYFYLMLVGASLFGEVYAEGKARALQAAS